MPLVKEEEKGPEAIKKSMTAQKNATCTTSKHSSWFGAPQLRAASQPPASNAVDRKPRHSTATSAPGLRGRR
jgi:hypothetical protein